VTRKAYYISDSDPGKEQFLTNLANKIGTYAPTMGISPAEVASIVNDAAMFKYVLRMQEVFKTFKQSLSAYKNLLRDGQQSETPSPLPVAPTLPAPPTPVNDGIFWRARKLVARIKASTNYNESIGEDLGIVGDERTVDTLELKPELKSRVEAGHPVIIWKKGTASALDIYVDRKDGKGFVFLTTDTQPDYIDKYPMPKGVESLVWEYKGIYRMADKQVGQFSEPIQVTVTRYLEKG